MESRPETRPRSASPSACRSARFIVHLLGYELASAVAECGPPEAAEPCTARRALLALRDPALPPPAEPLPGRYRDDLTEAARDRLESTPTLRHLVGVVGVADAAGLPLRAAEVERAAAAVVETGLADVSGEIARAPSAWREPVTAGLLAGLERLRPSARAELLTPDVCRLLAGRDLKAAPCTAVGVIRWMAESGELDRVDATARLLRFPPARTVAAEREPALTRIWEKDPTADECLRLLDLVGAEMRSSAAVCMLPARAYVRTGLTDAKAVDVAERVRELKVPGFAAEDAEAVLIVDGLPDLRTPERVAKDLERLTRLTSGGLPEFERLIHRRAARRLTERDPRFRARTLRHLPEPARRWLVDAWLDRSSDRGEQAALVEIAIRLRRLDVEAPSLDEWAKSLVNGRMRFGFPESRFKNDPDLSAGLRELKRPRRWSFLPWGGR